MLNAQTCKKDQRSDSQIACVASVSSRVRRESCRDESKKKRNDGGGGGNESMISSSPLPLPLPPFFCSRSNFRAITRYLPNSQMAKKATSRLRNSLTGTPPRGKPFPLYGSRSKVCHHSCHPTKSCEIKEDRFSVFYLR